MEDTVKLRAFSEESATRGRAGMPSANGTRGMPAPEPARADRAALPVLVTEGFGCRSLTLATPLLVIGLGTTGARAAWRFVWRCEQELGRLPSGVVNYLSVDADHP